ncbi:MAG: gamma-glutamyltransferase [Dehalococcoidia bacterium]
MEQHRPVTLARHGIVSTPHYLASAAGLQILQASGNAVDAAIAASAVLNVVYPILCGTGGDLFMLIYDAKSDGLYGLDAAGRTASAATLDFFRGRGYTAMPQRGPLTVSVPGCVDGWQLASDRFGRLGLARVLQPAIRYADEGFGVSAYLADRLAFVARQDWCHESWRAAYAPGGQAPAANAIFRVPELARSLRLIAEQGRDVFYEGEIGQALADFLQREGGLLTREDLAAHHGRWVEPLSIDYHDCRIYELPPPTQGFAALQMLKLIEGFPLSGDPAAPESVHLLIEAKKVAFADRETYLADPSFMTVDPKALIDAGYLAERRRLIDPGRAAESVAPGSRNGDTIYLCTADGEGNAVSLIQSNWMGVGSGMVLPGYGIELHNRGNYFSLDPTHVNCIAPRKQPLHTLIPSMAFRNGRPAIVFGTQGGDGQAQVHLQTYTKLIDYGWNIQAALEAPRWIHGRGQPDDPPGLVMESRFPRATIDGLRALGHSVELTQPWTPMTGQAQGIVIDPVTGLLEGGADPRADGWAAGW